MKKFEKIIEYLFYAFVFLLPLQTRWIFHNGVLGGSPSQYFTYSFYGTEIFLFIIFLLGFIYLWKSRKSKEVNLKSQDFFNLFLLFFLVIALGFFWAIDRAATLYYFWKFFEGFLLLVLIAKLNIDFYKISFSFVLACLLQSILAMYQFFTQAVFASKWLGMAQQLSETGGTCVIESDCLRWLRVYGTLPHPNVLGGFLAIGLILLIVLILLSMKKWQKIFLWACLPVILAGLFFTFSKSAFLAFGLGFIFLMIFILLSGERRSRKIMLEILLVCFLMISILAVIYRDPVLTRIRGESRLEMKSIQERVLGYEESKKIIEATWLTGVGLGNFTLAEYELSSPKQPAYYYQPVHNVFFLAVVELGVVGFIILILIFAEIFRRIYNYKIDYNLSLIRVFKKFRADGNYEIYRERFYWFLATTAVVFALLVIMVLDHYTWTLYQGLILFWLGLGLWLKSMES
ncbi:MAG: O-antigen ligase family protein [Patescibacteria group bacterium]|nr:O-antigen ligase family protein [Patescibacteria group bacterium]